MKKFLLKILVLSLLATNSFVSSSSYAGTSIVNVNAGSKIDLREDSSVLSYRVDSNNMWTSISSSSFPLILSASSSAPGDIQLSFLSGTYTGGINDYLINTIGPTNQLNVSFVTSGLPIQNPGAIGTLINNASISGDYWGIDNSGTISNITNTGTISAQAESAYAILNSRSIGTLTNSGSILANDFGSAAIFNSGAINTITNDINHSISAYYFGIFNTSSITTLNNNGYIGGNYHGIYNSGTITTLNNTGSIIGSSGIGNYGTITNLNNLQGASSSALTYSGPLPSNYNIIINNTSDFGKISFITNMSGSTTFGISSLTGINIGAAGTRYKNVISGLDGSFITNEGTTQTYTNGRVSATYQLLPDSDSEAGTWDLSILSFTSGPTAADTQASLTTQARRLRSTFNSTMASGNFANMNTYDCNLFDKNNMCISAGGRYTSIDNPSSNNSAAVVVLGYKVNSNIRIGGFLDQSVNSNTPTGIQVSNKNPMMGAFAVWNQNADGLGYQVKIANAYQDKDVRSTRDAYGDTGEAGTGKTNLNTQSYVGELSYAFNYQDSTIVRPYFAVRYTNIKQDAYTEDLTASVTAPLTYAKLGDRSTTALMGVKLNHALTPRTNLTASLGVEQDLHHKTDQLVASGVADLTSENFNNNIKRTRPVASAGAYYAVTKTQRLSGEVYYQQLPFQSTGSATAYFNYMIGF